MKYVVWYPNRRLDVNTWTGNSWSDDAKPFLFDDKAQAEEFVKTLPCCAQMGKRISPAAAFCSFIHYSGKPF